MLKLFKISGLLLLCLFVFSCGKEDDPVVDSCVKTGLTYTKDIKTLLASCAVVGCHNSGSLVGSYANYADTKISVGFGRLSGALRHTTGFSAMPKGGTKLSDCNISKIEAWIAAGMPE